MQASCNTCGDFRMEKTAFYTYMCTVNENQMINGSLEVQHLEIFNILGHLLPFQPLDNLDNQNFNIEKNPWRYYYFTFAP